MEIINTYYVSKNTLGDAHAPPHECCGVVKLADHQREVEGYQQKVAEWIKSYEIMRDAHRDLQAQLAAANNERDSANRGLMYAANSFDQRIEAVQAQLATLTEERDIAERALQSKGYRKECDIPACNCGPQWSHGGRAEERLREISDALPYQNGVTLLGRAG
jgi:hypothetical protein